ncbi:MAG TPA: FtsW/RodA/SpoVE family cell cycle protein, partial [Lachnospiraceae bacterium]
GLIMLYSASSYVAIKSQLSDKYYFMKQAALSIVSLVGSLLVATMDYRLLLKSKWLPIGLYGMACVLMMAVRLPGLGVSINGARRWLRLGITFQPSEVAKVAVIVFIPYLVVKHMKLLHTLKENLIVLAWGALPALMAFKLTDNLSTGIIIGGITFGILFIASPKTKVYLLLIVGLAIVFIGGSFLLHLYKIPFEAFVEKTQNFRFSRVLVWLDPEAYSSSGGYQTIQALYAIGSGGFFGKGLGNSTQKLGFIPETQNDMIFSIICEELGVFGAGMILILFAYLLYRLFIIAKNAPTLFGGLMVSGIFIHIALQVVLNVCVVLNVIPNTGITLPFISYGGTSVVFLMSEMALALSVSKEGRIQRERERRKREAENFY